MSNNQAPEQLFIQFDGNSPESLRTIYMQGESQPKKANEYNVSVFNADGTTATGTVSGMVSVDVYSPGADRPETTANALDLSTNVRKFTLFYATVDRAVFSVTGLDAGQKVAVSAYRDFQ